VTGLKKMLGADDSLDVFGVHGVCGILGALLTGVFNSPNLGGPWLIRGRLGRRQPWSPG
jgi:Amt family ammonium transporter